MKRVDYNKLNPNDSNNVRDLKLKYAERHNDYENDIDNAHRIKEMHDKYHPEVIFLTHTSAFPLGALIKEAWKKAWPNENPPKILGINPKNLTRLEEKDRVSKEYRKEIDSVKIRLKRLNKKGNVVVIDESGLLPPNEWMTGKYTFEVNQDYNPIIAQNKSEPRNLYRGSHFSATAVVNEAVKELGYNSKVGAIKIHEFIDRGMLTRENTDKEGVHIYRQHYHPGTKLQIKRLKDLGEYAGEIIVEENQRKKKLEDLLSVMIGIGGLGIGIFFLSNNITGNVIGNMTNSTSNIIGVGLLVIGLVAGFFWVKRR